MRKRSCKLSRMLREVESAIVVGISSIARPFPQVRKLACSLHDPRLLQCRPLRKSEIAPMPFASEVNLLLVRVSIVRSFFRLCEGRTKLVQ